MLDRAAMAPRLRRGREGVRHRHHSGQQCRHRARRPRGRHARREWRACSSIDLDAVFYWAQEAARRMLAASKPGAIVNIASVLGLRRVEGRRRLRHRQGRRGADDQGARPRTRLQGRARQCHRAGLVRHRHQSRIPRERGRREDSSARSRWAASARTATSTARCCCSPPMPAASSPAPPSWSTAARWWRLQR